jgi:hypothetical protein
MMTDVEMTDAQVAAQVERTDRFIADFREMVAATVVDPAKPKPAERIAERWRWLRRTLKAEHALIPRLAGEPVGFLADAPTLHLVPIESYLATKFCSAPKRDVPEPGFFGIPI